MKTRLLTLFASSFCAAALAQSPADLAKHNCAKPALPDAAKKLTIQERNAVVKELEGFRTCVRTFSEGQEKIKADKEREANAAVAAANAATAAAKAAAAAVDAAAKDYNDFSAQVVKIVNVSDEKKTGSNLPEPARPAKKY